MKTETVLAWAILNVSFSVTSLYGKSWLFCCCCGTTPELCFLRMVILDFSLFCPPPLEKFSEGFI